MPWDNNSGNNQNPWGSGGGPRKSPSGNEPDIEEIIRQLQQRFGRLLPGMENLFVILVQQKKNYKLMFG